MPSLLLRWIGTSLALYVATRVVPGVDYTGPWWGLLVVAVVFGLVNALVRPLDACVPAELPVLEPEPAQPAARRTAPSTSAAPIPSLIRVFMTPRWQGSPSDRPTRPVTMW